MTLSTWIMRVGARLIGLPVAVAVVLFAVSNRHLVCIRWVALAQAGVGQSNLSSDGKIVS